MNASDEELIDRLAAEVQASAKYQSISPALVRRIAAQELNKRANWKETVKSVRSRLHQVGAAYQEQGIAYAKALKILPTLPTDLQSPALRDFCRDLMRQHASTRERLPILDTFFTRILADLPPIHSVLDVACGLNPLALPFMPLAPNATYSACDIYQDLADFLNQFFSHLGVPGTAAVCDLTETIPNQKVDLALVLKTLPCLEQIDKSITPRLLAGLQAHHVLVSFPAQSLGGRSKGMPAFYEAHFREQIASQPWQIETFHFPGELAFLLTREDA